MTDSKHLIQEAFTGTGEETNPEYDRLIDAYIDNPFYDLTKDSIKEYSAQKEIRSNALDG